MNLILALIRRDLTLSVRQGGGVGTALGFFLTVVVLLPIGIGPDQALLARIALQAGMHAVGQKADRRQRSHGQHQRNKQQVQLTSAPIAAQHAQGLGPDRKT